MFKKVKKFYKEHKEVIVITVGGVVVVTAGVLLGKKLLSETTTISTLKLPVRDDSAERALLESFGAVYKEGYEVPFATKEIATKFMEERGKSYQIDILNDLTSVIWIARGEG